MIYARSKLRAEVFFIFDLDEEEEMCVEEQIIGEQLELKEVIDEIHEIAMPCIKRPIKKWTTIRGEW